MRWLQPHACGSGYCNRKRRAGRWGQGERPQRPDFFCKASHHISFCVPARGNPRSTGVRRRECGCNLKSVEEMRWRRNMRRRRRNRRRSMGMPWRAWGIMRAEKRRVQRPARAVRITQADAMRCRCRRTARMSGRIWALRMGRRNRKGTCGMALRRARYASRQWRFSGQANSIGSSTSHGVVCRCCHR